MSYEKLSRFQKLIRIASEPDQQEYLIEDLKKFIKLCDAFELRTLKKDFRKLKFSRDIYKFNKHEKE